MEITNAGVQKIPGFLLWQAAKLWQQKLTVALKPYDLTATQFVALANVVRLNAIESETTQIKLAHATKIDVMTISQVLLALEKKRLVERSTITTNKRAYAVSITPQGKQLAEQALGVVAAVQQEFFAGVQESQKLDILMETLRQLLGDVDERGAP
jgi:MarR family transcriptional regulator, organic hydroperoxide resistance regulator